MCKKNPLQVTCVFAFVVCPSALVQNLQTSQFAIRTSAPKNPRSSQGFPLPASSASALQEVGLGLSQTAAAAIEATRISGDFPSSFAPSPLPSPERRVSFQFPCSTVQPADQGKVLPWPLDQRTRGTRRSSLGGGWCSRRPHLPLGPEKPRAGRVCARARGIGREPSVEAAECRGRRAFWSSAKASKALELPERKEKKERKKNKTKQTKGKKRREAHSLKPRVSNSLGSSRSWAEAQLAAAAARTGS